MLEDGPGQRVQVRTANTAPVGIEGPISNTAAVRGPTAAASSSGSVRQPWGVGRAGTWTGTAPASRIRLTSPA